VPLRQMKVLGCGLQVPMTEQNLNGTQVRSRLEQMGGPTMAQGLLVLLMICTQQQFAIGSIPCMASKLM
jgi:hypothetical protein